MNAPVSFGFVYHCVCKLILCFVFFFRVSEFIPVSGVMTDAIHNQPCHVLSFNNQHQLIHVGRCDP